MDGDNNVAGLNVRLVDLLQREVFSRTKGFAQNSFHRLVGVDEKGCILPVTGAEEKFVVAARLFCS